MFTPIFSKPSVLLAYRQNLVVHMNHFGGPFEPACVAPTLLPPQAFAFGRRGGNSRATIAQSRVAATVQYMAGHLTERLNVNQLAALVHVSPSHYFAIFKRQTSYAPIDFLIRLRMRHGCLLLERQPLTVKEIAAALGYEDAFYFSRLFKRVSKVAPRDYRRLSALARQGIRAAILPRFGDEQNFAASFDSWGR